MEDMNGLKRLIKNTLKQMDKMEPWMPSTVDSPLRELLAAWKDQGKPMDSFQLRDRVESRLIELVQKASPTLIQEHPLLEGVEQNNPNLMFLMENFYGKKYGTDVFCTCHEYAFISAGF